MHKWDYYFVTDPPLSWKTLYSDCSASAQVAKKQDSETPLLKCLMMFSSGSRKMTMKRTLGINIWNFPNLIPSQLPPIIHPTNKIKLRRDKKQEAEKASSENNKWGGLIKGAVKRSRIECFYQVSIIPLYSSTIRDLINTKTKNSSRIQHILMHEKLF